MNLEKIRARLPFQRVNHAGKHSEQMRKDAKPLPDGNSLCYDGETDGHWQLPPEIEEGGLVDPYMPDGRGQEIELFNSKNH